MSLWAVPKESLVLVPEVDPALFEKMWESAVAQGYDLPRLCRVPQKAR